MTDCKRAAMLALPAGKISMVLDTDTFNEVDDQFAVAYAVRAAQAGEITLEAIHAAPFENEFTTPDQGVENSYQEILRVLDRIHSPEYREKAFRGAPRKMTDGKPVPSAAVDNLIRLARDENREGPLYVVAIGCATNIASALMLAPDIKERIVLIWLAGNCLHWPHVQEYNACQDLTAARYIFDCGVPLVLMPAFHVTEGLCTSIYELEHYLDGKSEIGTFLVQRVRDYAARFTDENRAWSKVIWDIAGPAYLLHPEWFETALVSTPILTEDLHWATDPTRPMMRIGIHLDRDLIFMDVFRKLAV